MENASKALIMAGSVLMSMLVIGMVTFLYQQISSLKQQEADTDASNKIVKYMAEFEQFNINGLYGSDILSLANLQDHYNKTQTGELGYQPINISVLLDRAIEVNGHVYFEKNTNSSNYNMADIIAGKNSIEAEIAIYEETKKYLGKTVKYFSQKSYREIAYIFGITDILPDYVTDTNIDTDIGDYIESNIDEDKVDELITDIKRYRLLKSAYTEFKSKQFNCITAEYSNQNGRLTKLVYEEIDE